MIRRQVGQEYWLVTQDDHARLSGELARHLAGGCIPHPSCEAARLAIEMHDSGWPLHDDQPTLNPRKQPLDVFESPRPVTIPVWERSAELAMARDPYTGLLVSLHVFGLSIFAVEHGSSISSTWSLTDARARFEINRFQHRMIEIQETLRRQLGMRTDLPLTHGVSDDASDPAEVRLKQDFACLRAMDQLSLCICCTKPPVKKLEPPGVRVEYVGDEIHLDPWPFAIETIEATFAFRRLPAREYADESEFRQLLAQAPVERFTVRLRGLRI